LEITAGGFEFTARLEEDAAPSTVAAFRRLLPLESRIIHVRWSGEAGWIPFGDLDLGLGPENATCYPHPGELVLYPRFAVAGSVLALATTLAAQAQSTAKSPDVPTFGASAELVYVRFHVEKKGGYAEAVTREQLRVLEDGRPQTIAVLEPPSTTERTIPT
jgi:hypothetical protein